jgi:SAM-dependent methyltransferase
MRTERPCPLCGEGQSATLFAEANVDPRRLGEFAFASRKLPEYMHHRLLLCAACDLVFADAKVDEDQLHVAYEGAAFDSAREAAAAAATYARLLDPVLAMLPDRSAALDIGTGDGAFLRHLLALRFERVHGIEPSSAPIAAAAADVRGLIRQGVFEAGMFESRSFSLVTCFQTIEHVADPLDLCREAVRLLKPGGVLCLVGHDRRAMSARILGRKSPIFDIEHLQLFSPVSFEGLLRRAGLTAIRVRHFWNRYPLSYWTRLVPLHERGKTALLQAWQAFGISGLPVPLPAGNVMAVGAKAADRDA